MSLKVCSLQKKYLLLIRILTFWNTDLNHEIHKFQSDKAKGRRTPGNRLIRLQDWMTPGSPFLTAFPGVEKWQILALRYRVTSSTAVEPAFGTCYPDETFFLRRGYGLI